MITKYPIKSNRYLLSAYERQVQTKDKNIRRRVVFYCFDSAVLFRFEKILICDYLGE